MAVDNSALTKRLLEFISSRSTFNQVELREHFQDDKKHLLPIMQKLVHAQRLQICKSHDNAIFWKVRSVDETRKYANLSPDHHLVLQEILRTESKGLWVRTIKARTKLPTLQINKILMQLEQRRLIKSVKSISAKKQKVYMGFEQVPDSEHTGGVWYNAEGDFDEEFVRFISKWVLAMVKQHGTQSVKDLVGNLKKSKVSKVMLREEDLLRIVDKLRYENELEEFLDPEEDLHGYKKNMNAVAEKYEKKWKIVNKISSEQHLMKSVCGVCPVSDKCCIGGVVSPTTCIYMDKWLGSSNLKF